MTKLYGECGYQDCDGEVIFNRYERVYHCNKCGRVDDVDQPRKKAGEK